MHFWQWKEFSSLFSTLLFPVGHLALKTFTNYFSECLVLQECIECLEFKIIQTPKVICVLAVLGCIDMVQK